MIKRPQMKKTYPGGVSRTTEEHKERIAKKQKGLSRGQPNKRDKTSVYKK